MKTVAIIAVTSYALAGDEAKALAAGCNVYITWPYSPRALLAKVCEYLGNRMMRAIRAGSMARFLTVNGQDDIGLPAAWDQPSL